MRDSIGITDTPKTFIFEEETTQVTTILKCSLSKNAIVNIRPALAQLPIEPQHVRFRIYNFSKNSYEDLNEIASQTDGGKYHIPWSYIQSDVTLIKFLEIPRSDTTHRDNMSQSQSAKKERSRERTISEVLVIVKQWREIHFNPNSLSIPPGMHPGRKVNLQEAAFMIGISKKSLDDYYYQLRLGEEYGFNFKDHLEDKIGILRMFIKEVKPKGRKKDKNQKHPKRLRILEELNDYQISISSEQSRSLNRSRDHKSSQPEINRRIEEAKNISTNIQNQGQVCGENYNRFQDYGFDEQSQVRNPFNPFKNEAPVSIQDQFYNEFQFMVNEPNDPFLNLGNRYQQNGQENPFIEDNSFLEANPTNLFMKKRDPLELEQPSKMDEQRRRADQGISIINQTSNDDQFFN